MTKTTALASLRGNLLPTAVCSRCYMHFRTRLGRVREHDDQRGNRCPGSGLEPHQPLRTVWWRAAVEA